MTEPINLHEYAVLARQRLPTDAWDYYQGGSDDERTLQANEIAFRNLRLRPRALVDVSTCRLATSVLGEPVSLPVLIAPLGCQALAHPDGECATARAAHAVGTIMTVSTMANHSLETIAAASDARRWFQLYVYRNRAVTAALVRRAAVSGYRALVVTVDTPRMGRRERDMRNGFGLPAPLRFANFDDPQVAHTPDCAPGVSGLATHTQATFDPAFTWADLPWLRSLSDMPLVLKGILTAEDARRAVACGVDGLIVSNHGGRQLDGAVATLEALPEISAAVAGRCEIYLDGGVRRGTDVLKALALGARAVLLGRPVLWGLTVAGEAGVRHVFELLRAELDLAMALAGVPTLAAIDRSLVQRSPRLCAD